MKEIRKKIINSIAKILLENNFLMDYNDEFGANIYLFTHKNNTETFNDCKFENILNKAIFIDTDFVDDVVIEINKLKNLKMD